MKNAILASIVLAMAGISFAAPTLYNASFEVPDTSDAWWEPSLADQGGQGWDFYNGGFHAGVVQANYSVFANYAADDGAQMGSLWSPGDEIAQTVSGFAIGETYTISWSERSRQGYTGSLWVLMNDDTLVASHAVGDASWQRRTAVFTATATSHSLRFFHSGSASAMVHVDHVEIEEGEILTDLLTNPSFEQTFNTYTGSEGSYSYCNTNWGGAAAPGWSIDPDWGYVWNPPVSGINHWSDYVGLTGVSDGVAAMGAWGTGGHYFETYQDTGLSVSEGDKVTLTFDSNALSADYGSQAWLYAELRFIGGRAIWLDYDNTPQDVWVNQTVQVEVTAADAGRELQVYFKGAGVWIDNVDLSVIVFSSNKAWAPGPGNGEGVLSEAADSTLLEWNAGAGAIQHDLYFGTVSNEVANGTGGTYRGRQAGLTFDPGTLNASTTYYWRVDEVDGASGMVTGEVWAFTVGAVPRDLYADTWVAIDGLDRPLPDIKDCGAARTGRIPGIFYLTWHGARQNSQSPVTPGPYDVTAILAANPGDPEWVDGNGIQYWWGKPEEGYFLARDEWVIRRNISMLTDAGIEILYLDATNAQTYYDEYMKLCEVLYQMKLEGYDTPLKIVFFSHSFSAETATKLYRDFYEQGFYSELWYMKDGKPLILGYPDGSPYFPGGGAVTTEVRDFFTWRPCWYVNHEGDDSTEWSWQSIYPQGYGYTNDVDRPEEMAITATGGRGPMSREGRSYNSASGQPAHNEYHLPVTGTQGDGIHFAEQIARGLAYDPEYCMVGSWNEWVSGRWQNTDDGGYYHLGEPVPLYGYFFVDQYNQEYSRDIAPMEGGHTDNYYYQMVDAIRRYKGVRAPQVASGARTIAIDGSFMEWADVGPEFRDTLGDTFHRNHDGWGSAGPYLNNTGRNDLLDMKVARDQTYVYFYAKTRDALSAYTDPNWMLLFIDADQDHATGWEGYDYVLNRSVGSASLTTLEQTSGGWNWTAVSSAIAYAANGNEIEIRVPRALIGQGGGDDPVAFDFHWADNIQADDDIAEFFTNGDSAPNRRFNYRYQTSQPVATPLVSNGFETGATFPDWDISTAEAYTGTHSLECSRNDRDGTLVSVPTAGMDSFRVSFKYKLQNVSTFQVWYHDGSVFVPIDTNLGGNEEGVWLQFSDVRYNEGDDARFFNGSFGFHLQAGYYMVGNDQYVWVDDVEITGYAATAAATGPYPPDGATGVSIAADLGWTSGAGALSHDVYFGTGSPGSFQGNQSGSEIFDPGTLEYGTTYFWRIDEHNAGGTETGDAWSFTTEDAPPPSEYYAAWAGGFGLDTNGSGAMAFDYEPDGLDNLAEYALGGNPTTNDAAGIMPLFGFSEAGGSNVIDYVYRRRVDAALRGLSYGLNISTNLLAEWIYVSNAYETGTGTIDTEFESVTNAVPFSTDEGFIGLEIEGDF